MARSPAHLRQKRIFHRIMCRNRQGKGKMDKKSAEGTPKTERKRKTLPLMMWKYSRRRCRSEFLRDLSRALGFSGKNRNPPGRSERFRDERSGEKKDDADKNSFPPETSRETALHAKIPRRTNRLRQFLHILSDRTGTMTT